MEASGSVSFKRNPGAKSTGSSAAAEVLEPGSVPVAAPGGGRSPGVLPRRGVTGVPGVPGVCDEKAP